MMVASLALEPLVETSTRVAAMGMVKQNEQSPDSAPGAPQDTAKTFSCGMGFSLDVVLVERAVVDDADVDHKVHPEAVGSVGKRAAGVGHFLGDHWDAAEAVAYADAGGDDGIGDGGPIVDVGPLGHGADV